MIDVSQSKASHRLDQLEVNEMCTMHVATLPTCSCGPNQLRAAPSLAFFARPEGCPSEHCSRTETRPELCGADDCGRPQMSRETTLLDDDLLHIDTPQSTPPSPPTPRAACKHGHRPAQCGPLGDQLCDQSMGAKDLVGGLQTVVEHI